MKNLMWSACLILCWLWLPTAKAQNTLIVQEAEIASRSLSGHVYIGLGNVVGNGVLVELCSPNWERVIVSTKTDDTGYFSLEGTRGHLFYLRFSSPGVNPLQVKVRIRKQGARELSIHLNIAT